MFSAWALYVFLWISSSLLQPSASLQQVLETEFFIDPDLPLPTHLFPASGIPNQPQQTQNGQQFGPGPMQQFPTRPPRRPRIPENFPSQNPGQYFDPQRPQTRPRPAPRPNAPQRPLDDEKPGKIPKEEKPVRPNPAPRAPTRPRNPPPAPKAAPEKPTPKPPARPSPPPQPSQPTAGKLLVTESQFRCLFKKPSTDKVKTWMPLLNDALRKYGITSYNQVVMFLAQTGHETDYYNTFKEYTNAGGTNQFCHRYKGGCTYIGRGAIQLTHNYNYQKAGAALGQPFVQNPKLVEQPKWAFLTAGWFWKANNLGAIADRGDFTQLTRRINGGLTHLAKRQVLFNQAKRCIPQSSFGKRR